MNRPRTILLPVLALLLAACAAERSVYLSTSFREPADEGLRYIYSRDGYRFEELGGIWLAPEVGTQRLMRDPSVAEGPDGTFHLVWTSSWRDDCGIGYARSRDLVHWTGQRHIGLMDPCGGATLNVWAPELFYDGERGEFVIVWASAVEGRFDSTQRLYSATTRDFEHFSTPELFYDPGYNSIDGAVLQRGPGDCVLAVKDNRKPGHSNIHAAFGPTPRGPWSRPTEPFTPEWAEGPTWARVGDDYVIYFDLYRQYRFGAVKTRDFKTFTDITEQIRIPRGHKHGTILMITPRRLRTLLRAARRHAPPTPEPPATPEPRPHGPQPSDLRPTTAQTDAPQ